MEGVEGGSSRVPPRTPLNLIPTSPEHGSVPNFKHLPRPVPRKNRFRGGLVHPPLTRATGPDTLPGFGGYFRAHTIRWSFCPLQHRLLCLKHIVELVGSALRNLLGAPHPKQRILGGISCRKQVRFPSMVPWRAAGVGNHTSMPNT